MTQLIVPSVPGATELAKWFGAWPSFHDAEILDLKLDRAGSCTLRVYTWRSTTEVNGKGQYVQKNHVVVTFWLGTIVDLELNGFSDQNVVSGLDLQQTSNGYKIVLSPCYGLAGEIEAESVRVTFEPGGP